MSLWFYDPFQSAAGAPRHHQIVPQSFYRDPFISAPLHSTLDALDHFLDDSNQLQPRTNPAKFHVKPTGEFDYVVSTAGFRPEELNVDLEGNELIVKGEHNETKNGETVYRSFVRRITLPEGTSKESLKCEYVGNKLSVTGTRKAIAGDQKRSIPIKQAPAAGAGQIANGNAK